MIHCPPLEPNYKDANSGFFLLLDILFLSNIIVNPYVIYCIIFRSTRYMKSYRWFLLYHQIIAFTGDISINFLTKPVFLLPFTAAYPMGILKGIVHPRYMLMWCGAFIFLSIATVGHLITFRYVTARGWKTFPWRYKICMFVYVLLALAPVVGVHLSYRNEKDIFKEWSKAYSCITPEIMTIPNIMAYDRSTVSYYACVPLLFAVVVFVSGEIFFIVQTARTIRFEIMSTRLKKMQRLFLVQVMLQAFIPLVLVIIPGVPFVLIMMFEVYGLAFWSSMLLSILSSFSLIGALVLILLNPTFRNWSKKAAAMEKSTIVVSIMERRK